MDEQRLKKDFNVALYKASNIQSQFSGVLQVLLIQNYSKNTMKKENHLFYLKQCLKIKMPHYIAFL